MMQYPGDQLEVVRSCHFGHFVVTMRTYQVPHAQVYHALDVTEPEVNNHFD